MSKTAIIAGLGPGFCERLAWHLARDGYALGLFARSEEYLERVATDLRDAGHDAIAAPTDVTDPDDVRESFERVRDAFGPVTVLAHTASTTTSPGGAELDPDRFEHMWRLYAYGGLLCFREALDDMRENGGTALFFGASPDAGDFAFKSGKDATRGLARSLADEYGPDGIHVAHVVIAGGILNPDVYDREDEVNEAEHLDPDAVAETCMHLIEQDQSAWTFELDLRPHVQGLY